jgi:hypothetical protein
VQRFALTSSGVKNAAGAIIGTIAWQQAIVVALPFAALGIAGSEDVAISFDIVERGQTLAAYPDPPLSIHVDATELAIRSWYV